MALGLMARLKSELHRLIESDQYKDKLFIKNVKFHTAPAKQNFTAWLGGSIYSGTDLVITKSLNRDTYFKTFKVPDWNCISEDVRSHG